MSVLPVPRRRLARHASLAGLAAGTAALLALAGCGTPTAPGIQAGTTVPPYDSVQLLANRGALLYVQDGCSGCHSTDGASGIGPTFRSMAYSEVTLADGRRLSATPGFLEKALLHPGSDTDLKGYPAALMERALAPYDLAAHAYDVQALVTFIEDLGP